MTTEIIEGEAHEVPPERAVVAAPQRTQVIMGSASLALMPEAEFAANLEALALQRRRGDQIKRALMAEGTDFGVVPGVTKAFLWKSGAETLDKAFGLVATFSVVRVPGNGEDEPPYAFHAHSYLHLGSKDGPVVGEGFGTCNPWETRYRYRNAERTCPTCGKPAVIKGKAEYGGGWLCWKKRDGCGQTWPDGSAAIEGQTAGQVENENPWDLENTIAKMAEKRAHVDGTIRATGTSGLFTQDDDSPAVQSDAAPVKALERNGDGSIIGTVVATKKDASYFLIRTHEEGGPSLGFRLESGNSAILVETRGPLAVQLDAARETVIGARITAWGHVRDKSFPKGRGTVTYQVLAAERVSVPSIGVLPTHATPQPDAPQGPSDGPTEAESEPLFSDDEQAEVDAKLDDILGVTVG